MDKMILELSKENNKNNFSFILTTIKRDIDNGVYKFILEHCGTCIYGNDKEQVNICYSNNGEIERIQVWEINVKGE